MSGEPTTLARILVVDDSRLMLRTAQKILSVEFDVVTAVDGEDAWEQLERDGTIQLVFTDLNMPRSDGYDLLRKVRTAEEPGLYDLPVILVTGDDDDELARQKALDLGATDFITKPFTSTDLVARARAHAKYQRITRQLQAHSTLDPLTGMTNEAGFLERLQQDISYARRHQQAMTLMRMEIEDLPALFVEHGKDATEALVVHVSNLVRKRIRKEDTAAHVGLGAFAVSLPGGHLEGIEGLVEHLRRAVAANPPEVDGKPIVVTLAAAVLSAELHLWPSAQDAMERCQELIDSARQAPAMATSVAVPPPHPEVVDALQGMSTASVPESMVGSGQPAPAASDSATSAPFRLDVFLDQIAQGHTGPAIDNMQQIMQHLFPLLRLLNTSERAQLVHDLGGL